MSTNTLSTTPVNYQSRDLGNFETDLAYAIQVVESYIGQIEGMGLTLSGLKLLELGPGINFGPPLMLAGLGAEVSLADRFLAPWDESYHPRLYEELAKRWNGPKDPLLKTVQDGGYGQTLRLLHEPAETLSGAADGEFDLVMSNAVLEHVFDFGAVAREMARVTRRGGLNAHQIDFRDHKTFDRPLEFLLISDADYAAEFAEHSGERGNRVRPAEAEALFAAAGFSKRVNAVNNRPPPGYLDTFVPRLRMSSSSYRNWPEHDFGNTSSLLIIVSDGDDRVAASGREALRHQAELKAG